MRGSHTFFLGTYGFHHLCYSGVTVVILRDAVHMLCDVIGVMYMLFNAVMYMLFNAVMYMLFDTVTMLCYAKTLLRIVS
jgi:hypothetical protein